MNIKRERLQVIHDILKSIYDKNGRIKPTHILYKANLSHQMLEEYLNELIKKGFVIEQKASAGKTYALTDKGFNYVNEYKVIVNFIDSFGLN